jgi:uncharacterized protein (TIGR03000 family)
MEVVMKQRLAGPALLGAAALLLLPATGSAQFFRGMGWVGPRVGYGPYFGAYNYGYSPYTWGTGMYSGYGYGYQPWGYNAYSYYPGSGYDYGGTYNPGYTWTNNPGYTGNYYTPGYYSGYTTPAYRGTDSYGGSYSYGTPSRPQARDTALVNVRVPTGEAEVWIEGKKTQQQGTWREFVSPPLDPSKNYTYDVRARWTEDGRNVERTRSVPVRANDVATVDFTSGDHSRTDMLDRGDRGTDRGTTPATPVRPGTGTDRGGTQPQGTLPPSGSGTRPRTGGTGGTDGTSSGSR